MASDEPSESSLPREGVDYLSKAVLSTGASIDSNLSHTLRLLQIYKREKFT